MIRFVRRDSVRWPISPIRNPVIHLLTDPEQVRVTIDPQVMRAALKYGPAIVGAGVWGFARHPEKLGWAAGGYAKAFGLLSAVYEEWTKVEGYGEALDAALEEVRNPPATALDLATGTGYAAGEVRRRFPSARITGVDISEEMVAIASHQAMADGSDSVFQVADSQDLPFEDGGFDLVTIQNSIVWPEEMMRVTAPGGRAVVVYSFGGPWVKLAWKSLAERFEKAGAEYTWGDVAGCGFYGVARKSS